MNKEEAKKLEGLHDAGYLILISSGRFLDGPVNALYESEEENTLGQMVYSSEVYTDRPLQQVHTYEVEVYAPAITQWPEMKESMDTDTLDRWESTVEMEASNVE
jgi:hypothetical protein